jgi:hypothetical protein
MSGGGALMMADFPNQFGGRTAHMRRYHPATGELFTPHRFSDGRYRVADPSLGAVKHHAVNQIAVSTEEELLNYARRGF